MKTLMRPCRYAGRFEPSLGSLCEGTFSDNVAHIMFVPNEVKIPHICSGANMFKSIPNY